MTDAKTLEREKIAAVIRKSITDYYQDNYEKRFLVVGQNALVQEAVEKGADIAASAIQSLRASGTGEGDDWRANNWLQLADVLEEAIDNFLNSLGTTYAGTKKAETALLQLFMDNKGDFVPALRAAALRASGERGSSSSGLSFQKRVINWLMECFSMEICRDTVERNHRFLEESLELVQSLGCTASEAHQLVDYVYGRPQGEINQEAGGVMVTLAALCFAADIDMQAAGETELARVWTKIPQIRAKQASKPKHSPLPESSRDHEPHDTQGERG